MPSPAQTAVQVAIEWSVPALLGLLGTWAAVKWRSVRDWFRSVKARKAATEAMVTSWPTALRFIEGAEAREEKTAAREVRVTAEFAAIRGHLERQDSALERISAQLWGQMKLDPQARFQCDHAGRNEQVNAAYAAIMRVGEFDLMGYGWKNRVFDPDRREYEALAAQAFREHRKFERAVRFVRGDGTMFRGLVRIEPYPEDPADLADGRHPLWFGSVVVVEEIE